MHESDRNRIPAASLAQALQHKLKLHPPVDRTFRSPSFNSYRRHRRDGDGLATGRPAWDDASCLIGELHSCSCLPFPHMHMIAVSTFLAILLGLACWQANSIFSYSFSDQRIDRLINNTLHCMRYACACASSDPARLITHQSAGLRRHLGSGRLQKDISTQAPGTCGRDTTHIFGLRQLPVPARGSISITACCLSANATKSLDCTLHSRTHMHNPN